MIRARETAATPGGNVFQRGRTIVKLRTYMFTRKPSHTPLRPYSIKNGISTVLTKNCPVTWRPSLSRYHNPFGQDDLRTNTKHVTSTVLTMKTTPLSGCHVFNALEPFTSTAEILMGEFD
ncbi:hypothetical protein DPMN_091059 [Dreissena polymorpha]|uniref:Uncharacterized protein n=1 Tax=Dreissena polymorpha TaxID=45954 RepID=A0A9D4KZU0_DREPO|nr:hypothetical protein DPMN_091059 [Dreissena polymorpha]